MRCAQNQGVADSTFKTILTTVQRLPVLGLCPLSPAMLEATKCAGLDLLKANFAELSG